MRETREKIGPLMDIGGNLYLESEDVGEVRKAYFASIFIKEVDMEDSRIGMGDTNMLGHVEIKEVTLGLLKSMKRDKYLIGSTPGS